MITAITLQRLRNSEFLQFLTDTLSIVQLNDPALLQVQPQYTALLAAKNVIEGLFKKDQASVITDELIELDAQRDNLINGIIALLQGNTHHFDATLKKHAKALQANVTSYGPAIARENYQSETAIINNLLNDWTSKPELAAAITALNLASWQTQLATANTTFNTRYLARTQEIGGASTDNMKEQRLLAGEAYYELRDFINSYFTINKGVAPFGKTVNELNALIDQYIRLISARKSGDTPGTPVA